MSDPKNPSPLNWRLLLRRLWPELLTLTLVSAAFTLLPALGLLWLAQQGWLAWWLALCAGLMGLLALLRLLRSDPTTGGLMGAPRPGAAAAECQARADLAALAAETSAEDLANREAVDRLLRRTVNAVASAYAPDDEAAVLNFTLPEVLLMLEEVARRLRHILSDELPVLRHLRLSWAARGSDLIGRGLKPARGLANAWRVMRLADPLGAVIAEVRSLVIEQGVTLLGREARAVMATLLVREVGEVAIELYSGAYRQRAEPPPQGLGRQRYQAATGPLRVLVTGQRNSGKSSLVNALLGRELAAVGLTQTTSDWTLYQAPPLLAEQDAAAESANPARAGAPVGMSAEAQPWELIDSPSLAVQSDAAWLGQLREADLVIWVVAAHRADRAPDQRALNAMREQVAADVRLRPVPLVLVLTHADRLEPVLDWQPPYDPIRGQGAKERNMARALHAASTALAIAPERALLVALGENRPAWNLPALRQQLRTRWPEAEQKRLERLGRAEGVVKAGVDLLRSVPGAIERARHFLRR
ncbi:GTPase family protein [Thiorhodovibrio frisius]|uniref:Putative GTPase n=1 Tax=Thiorhodovibrio frisius TaxID=631362 RepID=H8Z3G3_9GAMM|nr:GTPase domain-containing protein [Thiorhodovibrio frisius]EIC21871.1 putative GTPase [Thiorhodovibrio frisius]WPL24160.1 tRNA modification GTPase TrmE [Thiorhodovibrio frisius]